MKFFSTTLGEIELQDVIDAIKGFLEEEPIAEYGLVIGTDSQEKIADMDGKRFLNVVTAVVVHRKGFGGKYFLKKKKISNIHTLRDKIYAETLESLEFAREFVPLFQASLNGSRPKYHLEIHVDVGEHGDTRDMIKEVVGMVTGSGYIARTKPFSFAASHVADKHT